MLSVLKLESVMTDAKINNNGMVQGYKTSVSPLDHTSDRFYPVRVYDKNGKLKYELSKKDVKADAEKKLGTGKHWRTARVYPIGHVKR